MSVLPAASLALFAAIALFVAPVHSSDESLPAASGNLTCTSDQTQCSLGCCPYPNAECCSDGYECCPYGQACIPVLGICLKIDNENKKPALVSSRATPVESLPSSCPSGTTACGPDRCCNLPDATCCVDGDHCCPHGYRCDLPNKRCVKNSDGMYSLSYLPSSTVIRATEPLKPQRKDPYKSCPGGARQCPSYMSCCLNDDGAWGCCPNPTSPHYKKKGSNMCCNTMHGYICCPAWAHACTYIGCM